MIIRLQPKREIRKTQLNNAGALFFFKKNLESFLDKTQVDEIMAVSHIYEHSARLRSFEMLASL